MSKPTTTSWTNSLALEKLGRRRQNAAPLRLAFFDLDGTWTGNPAEQQAFRHALEKHGYVVVTTTNRDLELNLSFTAFNQSPPGIAQREYGDIDRATLLGFTGLLDPDIVASTLGEEIAVKQTSGGYLLDEEHQQSVSLPIAVSWQSFVGELLERANAETAQTLGTLLPSPHLRIQTIFATLAKKNLFQQTVEKLRLTDENTNFAKLLAAATLTDESDPYIDPPFFSLFITPAAVSKKNAVEHIVVTLAKTLAVPASDFEVLIAGDGPADLAMGLFGASGTHATFLIPGGARLTRYLQTKDMSFVSADLAAVPAQLAPLANQPGFYQFAPTQRTVVLGDEAFPQTTGPETLAAWLNALSA